LRSICVRHHQQVRRARELGMGTCPAAQLCI
jgi:hypothetical protein